MSPPAPGLSKRSIRLLLVLALIVLPALLPDFRVFQISQGLILALAILGLSLLTGANGQISLGHGAFFALGAYTVGMLTEHAAWPWWACVPTAAAVCFVAGFALGWPALKLEGPYLALASFALALAVPQWLKHPGLEGWTGGTQGLFLNRPAPPQLLPVSADLWSYLIVLAVSATLFAACLRLLEGRLGRAVRAIRDQPVAAQSFGVDLAHTKTVVFGLSALLTGVAGALNALLTEYVAPDAFPVSLSLALLVGLVVGGLRSPWGCLPGAAFLLIVPDLSTDVSKAATGVIYALAVLLVVFRMPEGLWGVLVRLHQRIGARRG